MWNVHRFPGICLTIKENSGKPQLGDLGNEPENAELVMDYWSTEGYLYIK